MAKAPRVGDAKTRLVPALSLEEAAALSACFIRDAAENITAAARQAAIEGYIAYAPKGAEAEFRPLLAQETRLLPSRRAGLGASLYDAAADLLADGYGSVCLLNSDSPTLPTSVLVEAARALSVSRRPGRPRPGGGRRLLPDRTEAGASPPVRGHRLEHLAVFAQTAERAPRDRARAGCVAGLVRC